MIVLVWCVVLGATALEEEENEDKPDMDCRRGSAWSKGNPEELDQKEEVAKDIEKDVPTMNSTTKEPVGNKSSIGSSPFCMNWISPKFFTTVLKMASVVSQFTFLSLVNQRITYHQWWYCLSAGYGDSSILLKEDWLLQAFDHDESFTDDNQKAAALQEVVGRHTADLDV